MRMLKRPPSSSVRTQPAPATQWVSGARGLSFNPADLLPHPGAFVQSTHHTPKGSRPALIVGVSYLKTSCGDTPYLGLMPSLLHTAHSGLVNHSVLKGSLVTCKKKDI